MQHVARPVLATAPPPTAWSFHLFLVRLLPMDCSPCVHPGTAAFCAATPGSHAADIVAGLRLHTACVFVLLRTGGACRSLGHTPRSPRSPSCGSRSVCAGVRFYQHRSVLRFPFRCFVSDALLAAPQHGPCPWRAVAAARSSNDRVLIDVAECVRCARPCVTPSATAPAPRASSAFRCVAGHLTLTLPVPAPSPQPSAFQLSSAFSPPSLRAPCTTRRFHRTTPHVTHRPDARLHPWCWPRVDAVWQGRGLPSGVPRSSFVVHSCRGGMLLIVSARHTGALRCIA